jgi:hypothetical protein
MTVDEFVQARVLPEFRPVVAMIRELMRECAPQAQELISYGIPAYRMKRIVAVISPTKKDITFAFTHGTEFEDPWSLLRGTGKVGRHVKIRSIASANKEALRSYIRQALERDARQV